MSNQDEMEIYKRNIKDKIFNLINGNKLNEAQELITQYQQIVKNDVEIYQAQSIIFIQEGNYELAERSLIESIDFDKTNSDTFYNLGYLFQMKKKWWESYQSYQLAKQYSPDHHLVSEISNIQKELLNQQMKKDNFVKELYDLLDKPVQLTEFLDLLEKQQEEANNWKSTLENLININQVEEAKALLAQYKKIYINDVDVYSFQAIIDILEQRYDEAEVNLLRGLEFDSNNIDILFNLGYLFELTNDIKRAHLYYSKAVVRCNQKEIYDDIKNRLEKIQRKDPKLLRKRVLLVAYAFPPIGGPGVQRSLKFAKYLSKCGWNPVVLTVGWTPWDFYDYSLLEEITEDIDIIRIDDISPEEIDNNIINQIVPIYKELIANDKIFQEYIDSLGIKLSFVPEYQVVWANKVVNNIEEYINLNEIDLVYTSADPNADNIVGYYLKKLYQKPWVADFRDAWTQNPYTGYDRNGLKYKVECQMEKTLVGYADHVITVSEAITSDFIKSLNLDNKCVKTITNGYDEADFKHINNTAYSNDYFTIAHNGLFYQKRSPETFLRAIKNILNTKRIPKDKLKIYFTRKDKWSKLVDDLDLKEVVEFTGYMPHRESLEFANKSNLLLLIVGSEPENKGIYTGKIFEYLRLSKPILALSPKGSLVENLLEKLDRGTNIPFDNIQEIEDYIVDMFNRWESNTYPVLFINESIKEFSREELTNELINVFDDVLKRNKTKRAEKKQDFYNDIYKTGGWNKTYFKHYSEIHYYDIWIKALDLIKKIKQPSIIDIGCGPGQFANLLFDNKLNNYIGIDFSKEAIQIAKSVNTKYQNLFSVDNAFTSKIFEGNYNTAVLFEILEHIENDFELLKRLRKGTNVLLSVPNFFSEGHVRWFNDEREVFERYKKLIDISKIDTINLTHKNKIYLLFGIKK